MIKIYKSVECIGFVILEDGTGKLQYAEYCNDDRLSDLVYEFSDHDMEVIIDEDWIQEEESDLFYKLPILKEKAKITPARRLDVKQAIKSHAIPPKAPIKPINFMFLGMLLAAVFLFPVKEEYEQSVLTQAQVLDKFTKEFVDNQPSDQQLENLYTAIDRLSQVVNVEAISYSQGTYKIVFSTVSPEVVLEDLHWIEGGQLTHTSALKKGDRYSIHLYELEGEI